MGFEGIRSRQPVVGDNIGWWWDKYAVNHSAIEMFLFQKKSNYAYQYYLVELRKKQLLYTLLYTLAAEEA